MNSYQAPLPRAALSLAAVAMTALTLGLAVLPAQMSKDGRDQVPAMELTRGNIPQVAAREGTPIMGTPIVVYGSREQETVVRKVHMPHVGPPQKQQS